jgi:hypothetical protein
VTDSFAVIPVIVWALADRLALASTSPRSVMTIGQPPIVPLNVAMSNGATS